MDNKLKIIYDAIDDKKAFNIKVIDFKGTHAFLDYFIIASFESTPKSNAIIANIREKCNENGFNVRNIEGQGSEWVLIDLDDIVVHLFTHNARLFYDLDRLFPEEFVMHDEL